VRGVLSMSYGGRRNRDAAVKVWHRYECTCLFALWCSLPR